MELEDYKDIFADMRNSAEYYKDLGMTHGAASLIEKAQVALDTAEEALQRATIESAETWYNEIRGALRFCEDICEEEGLED